MTLKRACILMATIALLVGLTGLMPGAQTAATTGPAGSLAMESVSSSGADVARYAIGFQEIEPVRHVLPPPPTLSGLLGGKVDATVFDPVPGNELEYTPLGSATATTPGLPLAPTRARVSMAPDAATTIAAGDRLSFGPQATIVPHNRGEHPATVLTASVVAAPGNAA